MEENYSNEGVSFSSHADDDDYEDEDDEYDDEDGEYDYEYDDDDEWIWWILQW